MDRCLRSYDWSLHSFCYALTTAIVFSGPPASSVQSHRRIQNCSARFILKQQQQKSRKTDQITPLFQFLHWPPTQQSSQYEMNTLCYTCITGTAPSYLCDCLQLYTPSRTLRSASDTLSLQIPCTRLSTVGSRAFSVFGPSNME